MPERNPQQVIGGCLGRVFTVVGFAILIGSLINAFLTVRGGGPGFAITGAFFPAIVLLFMGTAIRRRVKGDVERPDRQIPPPRPLNTDRDDESGGRPEIPKMGDVPSRRRPAPRAEIDVPELPTVEPVHDPGELPAVADLGIEDFETTGPKSSEEMIKEARRRFNKEN